PGAADHVVVVAAHPDDETLGAGGLMALASRRGATVTVLVASDGEASHPASPTHRPEQLARVRRVEVAAALAEVAPDADLTLLGLPDGQLADHLSDICDAIDERAAGCTHLVTPWIGDGHPDHAACAQAAAESVAALHARHWQFPIWAWHWGDPAAGDLQPAMLGRLVLDPLATQAKRAALDCHVSQHLALSDEPGDEAILAPHFLNHFRGGAEAFVVEARLDRVPTAYFDGLYRRAPDPWGLSTRFYEQRKRAALLAGLTRPRFRRAFEPGCATGLLTTELACRCDEVVGWDVAAGAIEQAAANVDGCGNVSLARRAVPDEWPGGEFDLIVLSEVGYYCDPAEIAGRVQSSLGADGVLVACHWRHDALMHRHSAETVHAVLGAGRQLVVHHVEDDYLLQVWSAGRSVAAVEGMLP
ncbi:MAG: PIG-L family deacetylase, partial [Jatrophihabitantaceae bacterium]